MNFDCRFAVSSYFVSSVLFKKLILCRLSCNIRNVLKIVSDKIPRTRECVKIYKQVRIRNIGALENVFKMRN